MNITTDELRHALDDQERYAPDPEPLRRMLHTADRQIVSRRRFRNPLLLAAAVAAVTISTAIVVGHSQTGAPAAPRPAVVGPATTASIVRSAEPPDPATSSTDAAARQAESADRQAESVATHAPADLKERADRMTAALTACVRAGEPLRSTAPGPTAIRRLAATCAADFGGTRLRPVEWVATDSRSLDTALGYRDPATVKANPVIVIQFDGRFTVTGGNEQSTALLMLDPTGARPLSVDLPVNRINLAALGDVQR